MPTQTAIEAIRELAEAWDLPPETRQLAFHVHGMYVIGHDTRDGDVASAVAATELACRIHEVPVSINNVARAASIDPAVAERAYHELCDRLPYSVCEFLPRKVMFILDNLPAHFPAVAQLEEAFAETATSVSVEWFPTYAPELDPNEYVWNRAKYDELANYSPGNLDILQRRVGQFLTRKQDDQSFLHSCFKFAELEVNL